MLAPDARSAGPAAPDSGFPRLPVACYALGLFILAYLLYFVDVQVVTLLVAPLKQAYRITDTLFSLLASGPQIIAVVVLGLPMGWMVDRGNRRNLLAGAILLWTAMNALCAFAQDFWTLFLLKTGVAVGGAWFYPTVVSLISDYFPPRRRTLAFTALQLFGAAGVGLAVLMSGAAVAFAHSLAEIAIPGVGRLDWWRWSFLLVSAPAPLGAALLFTLSEPKRQGAATATEAGSGFGRFLLQHWGTLGLIAAGVAVANMFIFASRTWLPEYFIRSFHDVPAQAGVSTGLVLTFGAGAGIGLGGALAHWLRGRGFRNANLWVVLASYVTPVAILLFLPFVPGAAAAALALAAASVLFNLHGGPQIDILQGLAPNAFRGRFVTLVLILGVVGAFAGPVAVGALNDAVFKSGDGIRLSLTAVLLFACLGAALCWGLRARALNAILHAEERRDDAPSQFRVRPTEDPMTIAQNAAQWNVSERAAALHSDALVWDNTVPWSGFGRPELKRTALNHHIGAGADFISVTVATDSQTVEQTIATIADERRYFLSQPERFKLCDTLDDIFAAKAQGLLGVNFNFQGTNAFNRDLALVELYYKLGVRHALMAYNQKNDVGDGCHERADGGLSRWGVALIGEMNRVGMMVDCSHTGYRTSMDAFECSRAPVIFSHANARGRYAHERNITDDQIDACARTGGVIGVNGIGVFLGANDASTDRLLEQIDYIAQRVGARHVGIGLDWVYDMDSLLVLVKQMSETYPEGYDLEIRVAQPEQLPEITEGLLRRGWSDDDIRGVLGMNWVRVARQVWK